CTRREDRSSSEAPRREYCRGGVLDRRLDCGGAVGTARRIRVFPGRLRRLYPRGAARAAGRPGSGEPRHACRDRALCSVVGANRAATLLGHWAVAESGAAGPAGNRYGDPAGHSCIAVAGPTDRAITLETGSGDRLGNMHAFAAAALELLFDAIAAEADGGA